MASNNRITFILISVLIQIFLCGSVLGQYGDPYLLPLPTNPDGVTVERFQILVEESLELDDSSSPTANIIAKLDYTRQPGTDDPKVGNIDGTGATVDPPALSVVYIENEPDWENGFYFKLASQLDFEGFPGTWAVTLVPAAPNGPFALRPVDINDQFPSVSKYPEAPLEIEENAPISADALFIFEATDNDGVDAGKLTFTLEDLQEAETSFAIDPKTGSLTRTKLLDYENRISHRLQITVTDSDPTHVAKAPIVTVINVEDVNDQTPRWLRFQYRLEMEENTPIGDIPNVEYLAKDQDLGINDDIIYSLEAVPQNADVLKYLTIEPTSGKLALIAEIDAETDDFRDLSMDFLVVATEANDPSSLIKETVSLRIIDLNDKKPLIDGERMKEFPVTISEIHRDELPELDKFVVTDTDVTLDYSRYRAEIISDDDWLKDALAVSPLRGSETTSFDILVTGGDKIDFEQDHWRNPVEFIVRITAEDPGVSDHIAEAKITLTVQDANDNDPVFGNVDTDDGNIVFEVLENVGSGAEIGKIVATDADFSAQFGTPSIVYSWYPTEPTDLVLDPKTGSVTVKTDNVFDFERLDELLYYVEAADMEGGVESRRTTNILQISVKDVNDESPRIILPQRQVNIKENDRVVTVAEGIMISDPDLDNALEISVTSTSSNGAEVANWFKHEIVTEEPGKPIEIKIVVAEGTPDYEKTQRVDVAITVVDTKTLPGLPDTVKQTTEILSVILENENDEVPIIEEPRNIKVIENEAKCADDPDCNTESARYIYTFRANDADNPVEALEFSIKSSIPAMEALVEINATTGVLSRSVGQIIDRDRSYEDENNDEGFTDFLYYTVSVFDGINTAELEVSIPVEDINDEFPVWTFENTGYAINENSETGILVVKVSATDRDAGGNFGKVSYFIDLEYNDGNGANLFSMDQNSGELKVNGVLDREVAPDGYKLQIQARDNYPNSINTNMNTTIIDIKLLDLNDNKPEFSEGIFDNTFEDKAPPETVLGTVKVMDADLGNNGEVEVTIKSVTCEKCNNNPDPTLHFKGEWDLPTNTYVIKSNKDFLGWFGIFTITILAKDKGNPANENEKAYTLTVMDINDQTPEFVYPDRDDITFYINETLGVGERLVNWDQGPIPALSATDKDDPDTPNGQVSFRLESLPEDANDAASYFQVGQGNFILVNQALNIDLNPYVFNVVAYDGGDPSKFVKETLTVKVVPEKNTLPIFSVNETTFEFIENDAAESFQFENATDADIVDDQNLFEETICYYIVHTGPVPEDFPFLLDVETNLLTLSEPLDREEIDSYYFVVHAKNNLIGQCTPPEFPDPSSPSNIRVRVNVGDVKDTKPEWPPELLPVISGGVRTTSKQGSATSVTLRATDADLDETLTFSLGTTVDHSDPSLEVTNPFELGENNEIKIRFQPQAAMKGFFNFSVFVHDSAPTPMSAEAQCKIYLINENHFVFYTFNNDYTEFDAAKRAELSQVITRVFNAFEANYKCNIDDALPAVDGNGAEIDGKTRLEAHFIDSDSNGPVLKSVIENLQFDERELLQNLTLALREIGFSLDLYNYVEDKSNKDDVLTYILIAGVGVLFILLLIVSITCWFNNKSLSRRVRALTATTFGSQQSLDKIGTGLSLPNTNKHAIQGSNPIYSKEAEAEGRPRGIPDFDTESVGSGGSVLIGVEDDDDFRNYQENPDRDDNFQFGGMPSSNSNPMFEGGDENEDNYEYMGTQSQDDSPDQDSDFGRLEMPSANVTRRNPLMNMDSFDA